MKKVIVLIILISSITANSQSLKDLLYSGKLKSDTGSVVRKTDDLSSKIDTVKKKPVEPEKIKTGGATRDSSITEQAVSTDPAATATEPGVVAKNYSNIPKDNNRIWKEFIDSATSTLKSEVLPNKKIKSGTYYLLIEYEIGADGGVTVNNVSCSPENSFLQQQVKERLTLTAPQMIPVLSGAGVPRKAQKKYNLVLSKM